MDAYTIEKKTNKKLVLLIIITSAIITLFASDIYLPSIPQIADYFSVSHANAQLSISFFLGGQVVATLFWGICSDRIGRQKAFFLGMLLFFIGTLVCIKSVSLNIFLLGRLIQGLGGAASPVVGWALIQDLYPKDKSARIMAWIGSLIALAPMSAPAIGGQIDKFFGWKADFYLMAIMVFFLLMCQKILPNERHVISKANTSFFKTYSSIIQNRVFLSYVCLFALLACGEWSFLTISPFLYKNIFNLNAEQIGLFMSLSSVFFILGTILANRLLKKWSIDVLLSRGTKLSIVASLLLLFLHLTNQYQALLISLIFGVYLLSAALLWGATSSRALQCYETDRGAASAIRSLLIISFFTLGSYLGTLISHNSLFDIAILMLSFSLLSTKIYYSQPLIKHRASLKEPALLGYLEH